MSLKRIDLFELMNAYEDEEFEPKEGCFVSEDQVKEAVLAQVGQKKRHGRKVLVLAAALAACLALAGWTYGEQIYHFLSGGQLTVGENQVTLEVTDGYDQAGNPLVVSWDGERLWFVADGQRVDITEEISEEVPYCYTTQDEAGNRTYIVVGGTPERCGWMERWESADGKSSAEVYDGVVLTGEFEPEWLTRAREQMGLEN